MGEPAGPAQPQPHPNAARRPAHPVSTTQASYVPCLPARLPARSPHPPAPARPRPPTCRLHAPAAPPALSANGFPPAPAAFGPGLAQGYPAGPTPMPPGMQPMLLGGYALPQAPGSSLLSLPAGLSSPLPLRLIPLSPRTPGGLSPYAAYGSGSNLSAWGAGAPGTPRGGAAPGIHPMALPHGSSASAPHMAFLALAGAAQGYGPYGGVGYVGGVGSGPLPGPWGAGAFGGVGGGEGAARGVRLAPLAPGGGGSGSGNGSSRLGVGLRVALPTTPRGAPPPPSPSLSRGTCPPDLAGYAFSPGGHLGAGGRRPAGPPVWHNALTFVPDPGGGGVGYGG
jgi:hypothetical protein